jgi:hypothetical protein
MCSAERDFVLYRRVLAAWLWGTRVQHTHLEGQPVNQMRHSAQLVVLVARAGVDVYSQAREVAGQSFGSYSDAIGEGGDLV